MKKMLMTLFVVQMIFVAAVASAECVDKAKLVGTWARFDTEVENLGDDPPAVLKALEAGEKKLEEFKPMFGGSGYYPGDAQTMELAESGDLTIVATMADELDDDLEAYTFFTMKGTWSLDCEKLASEATSVEKMEISTAHLTAEQQKQFEADVAEMKAGLEEPERKARFEQQALQFYGHIVGNILYFSEKYMLLKTEDNKYMIFQKK